MRLIKKEISIYDLVDDVEQLVTGKKTLSSDPDCVVDLKFFDYSNYAGVNFIHKDIIVPICFVQKTENIGYYNGVCDLTGRTNDIWITGSTDSYLSEVINYSGNVIVGFNYANPPLFSGVLSETSNEIIYVINGLFENGYINNTGIIYITNKITGETTFMYNLLYFLKTDYCFLYKDKHMGYISPPIKNGDVFIDRNSIISVNEHFYRLMEIKTIDNFTSSIYDIYLTY